MKHTLGLGEFTLLNTGFDGLVELSIEDTRGHDMDVVVSRDVLLDRLATIRVIQSVSCFGVEKSGPPIPSGIPATAR